MSILVVLTIIMLAMAGAYATLRSQSTMISISENGQSRSNARQTAQAAMSIALRRMNVATGTNAWGGADSSFSGTFSASDRYTVSYFTGITDVLGNAILPSASNATATAEWPFCVTVVATGYGSSGQNGTNESSHRVRCVVRLSKPTLQSTPTNWAVVPYFSVIQWANSNVEMHLPARIDGMAYTQGGWDFTPNYPVDFEHRPFAGQIDEVTMYSQAMTATQVGLASALPAANIDYGNFLGLPSPVARWKLNDATGTTTALDSIGSWHGTYYGAKPTALTSTPTIGNRAAQFDGYNDVVNLGKFDLSGSAMTILAWFRADNFDNDNARIICKGTTASLSDLNWSISTVQSNGTKLRFCLKAGGSSSELIATSGNLAANTWTFVAATYDGTNMKLYKDTVLVGSVAKTGSINSNSNAWVFLGGNPPGSSRARYMRDLRAMELAGAGSGMPLHDALYLPRSRTDAETLSLLDEDLQAPTVNMTGVNATTFVSHPGTVSTYQLYPGGKSYSVSTLTSTLSSSTKQSNVQTNPLGIFTRAGTITFYDNNTIKGTLITTGSGTSGDIEISGQNNVLQPVDIPRLDGTSTMLQLPIVIAEDDFKVLWSAGVTATGAIVAGDDFRADEGNDSVPFVVQGKVIAKEFYIHRRWQWDFKGGAWWRDRLAEFMAQLSTPSAQNYSPYFPKWLKNTQSLDPIPKMTFGPDPANPTYHWHVFGNTPFYTYNSSTETGMHWDIIAWDDGA
jgi:hypothetical protein